MKKLQLVSLLIWAAVGIQQLNLSRLDAKRIILDIPEEEIAIVETYVVDAEEWIRAAWAGKVNQRREALIKEEIQDSLEKNRAIPPTEEEILQNGMTRMGARKERDAAEK